VEGGNWDTIFTDIVGLSIFNPCDVIGQQSNRIRRKTQNKGCSRSFKVIEVGIIRKPVGLCATSILVINITDIYRPTSYRFGVTAAGSNFGHFAFLACFGVLRDKVRCSSSAHWKARSGLSISVN